MALSDVKMWDIRHVKMKAKSDVEMRVKGVRLSRLNYTSKSDRLNQMLKFGGEGDTSRVKIRVKLDVEMRAKEAKS